jgi:hypothetical protein
MTNNQPVVALKTLVANWVLAHPALLEIVLAVPVVANALLTPATVVVLVSNNLPSRKR